MNMIANRNAPQGPQAARVIAATRCGRCKLLLRSVDVAPDGTFEIKELPTVCPDKSCQQGFGGGSYSLEVSMYQLVCKD